MRMFDYYKNKFMIWQLHNRKEIVIAQKVNMHLLEKKVKNKC